MAAHHVHPISQATIAQRRRHRQLLPVTAVLGLILLCLQACLQAIGLAQSLVSPAVLPKKARSSEATKKSKAVDVKTTGKTKKVRSSAASEKRKGKKKTSEKKADKKKKTSEKKADKKKKTSENQVRLWQLDDDTLLRLDEEGALPDDVVDKFAQTNPFPRDDRIAFFASNHSFMIRNEDGSFVVAPYSVTGIVRAIVPDFDADGALEQMKKSPHWCLRQLDFVQNNTILSDDEIKALWEKNGLVGRTRGTLMHYEIEQHLNGISVPRPYSPEFKQLRAFEREVLKDFEVLRTEFRMFHCGLRVGGIADLLLRDADGHLVIVDWKRKKQIRRTCLYRKLFEPLNDLDASDFNEYALQLNFYRYILETEYQEKVSKMILVALHPVRKQYEVIEVPVMHEEVQKLVQYRKEEKLCSDPVPGRDAHFPAD